MSIQSPHPADQPRRQEGQPSSFAPADIPERPAGGHKGHGLMMVACCIPMLVIVGILVWTGVASPGLIVVALVCTAMMMAMMFMMPGGHDH